MSDLSNDNVNKKARLGRGLGSLLGGAGDSLNMNEPAAPKPQMTTQTPMVNTQQPAIPVEARIWQVAIDKMIASEFQPRTHFEKEKLQELSNSIQQNGILQPIVARKLANGKFEIIAGERRWRAAQMAGMHQVPVILKTLENQAALELAIIENIQREDLNAIEEAEAYQRLAREFNLTQQQVAEKVGKERATVANALRLLALPTQIREMVVRSEISPGHAKVLLGVNDVSQQVELAKKVSQQKISVRQLEKMVTDFTNSQNIKKESPTTIDSNVTQRLIAGLAEEVQKILGTKVTIDYLNSKGKISIHYYSDDELTQIVNRLKESHGKR
jgi:ParB family chromosome partitioning protein